VIVRFCGLFFTKKMKRLIIILLVLLPLAGHTQPIKRGYVNISSNGYLYYEEKGEGEPLILLHGHSLDTRMWDMQFDVFAKHYRTVRFDFRGYGRSSKEREDFQFTHLDDLITLMDSLHIAKAHIVGLSMGGFIGSEMLAMYPERMLSAVLVSGLIHTNKGPSEPMDSIEAAKRDSEITALRRKGVDVMKTEWVEGLIASGGSQREKIRLPLWQMIDDWDAWQPLHKEPRVLYAKDAYVRLKKNGSAVPTLIVLGGAKNNYHSSHPEMLDYLSRGRVVVIPDCGHMLNMEKPQEFNKVVLDFLHDIN
jgi:3-oxoadipate enol-lactonase